MKTFTQFYTENEGAARSKMPILARDALNAIKYRLSDWSKLINAIEQELNTAGGSSKVQEVVGMMQNDIKELQQKLLELYTSSGYPKEKHIRKAFPY
jgi:hypothetical protein